MTSWEPPVALIPILICVMCVLCAVTLGGFFGLFFGLSYPDIESRGFKAAICNVTGHNSIASKVRCRSNSGVSGGTTCTTVYLTSVDVIVCEKVSCPYNLWYGVANKRNKYEFGTYGEAANWQNSHYVGETAECFYDPKNRDELVYTKGTKGSVRFILGIVFSILWFLCGLFLFSLIPVVGCVLAFGFSRDPNLEYTMDSAIWNI